MTGIHNEHHQPADGPVEASGRGLGPMVMTPGRVAVARVLATCRDTPLTSVQVAEAAELSLDAVRGVLRWGRRLRLVARDRALAVTDQGCRMAFVYGLTPAGVQSLGAALHEHQAAHPAADQRRRRTGAELEELLLAACGRLLDEAGYAGLSTTTIAQAAGLQVGALYRHFRDKDAVLAALTARWRDTYLAQLEDHLAATSGWRAGIETAIDTYADMYARPGFAVTGFGTGITLADLAADPLLNRFMTAPTPRIEEAVRLAFGIAAGLIAEAHHHNNHHLPDVLKEGLPVIYGYLDHYLNHPADNHPAGHPQEQR